MVVGGAIRMYGCKRSRARWRSIERSRGNALRAPIGLVCKAECAPVSCRSAGELW